MSRGYQAIETLPHDELARIMFQLEYASVGNFGDSWYSRGEVVLEIDRRVRAGLVANWRPVDTK